AEPGAREWQHSGQPQALLLGSGQSGCRQRHREEGELRPETPAPVRLPRVSQPVHPRHLFLQPDEKGCKGWIQACEGMMGPFAGPLARRDNFHCCCTSSSE
ncbi:unnamed protein product, partial [Pylaiella littoralis]